MADYISTQLVNRLSTTDQLSLSKFEREGERLGKSNQPNSSETDLSSIEASEVRLSQDALKKLGNEVTEKLKSLSEKKAGLEKDIGTKIPNEVSQLDMKNQNDLDRVESELGPKSAVFEDVQSRLSILDEKLKYITGATNGRELQVQIEKVYLPFMAALAFAEVWVNRLAFELFFESSPIISLFLAIAVGAVLVFFAHITGSSFKRSTSKEIPMEMSRFWVSMTLLNALVIVFIYYLGKMREAFVKINDGQTLELSSGDIFDDELGSALEIIGSSTPVDSFMSADIGEKGLFLILVNVVVYACGAVAAFIRHDSHPDFEKVTKSHAKLSKRSVYLRKSYQDKMSSIQKSTKDKNAAMQKELADKRSALDDVIAKIEETNSVYEDYRHKVEQALNEKLSAFRQSNKKSRTNPVPKYFKEKVKLS